MCRSDFVIDRPFFAGYRSQEKPFGRISVFVERWLFQPGLFGVAGHIPFRDSDIVCHGSDRVAF